MPRVEDYNYQHPWAVPEPHCSPGYTGFLAGHDPNGAGQMGQPYGWMTHEIMVNHPMTGRRLGLLHSSGQEQLKANDVYTKVHVREHTANDLKLRTEIVPGYQGYVPRKLYYYGKTYAPECREALAEFHDIQKEAKRPDSSLILPNKKCSPDTSKLLESRPYSVNKYELERMPRYARFETPKKYGEPFLSLGPLNPEKKFIPGYTGYIPGKPFHYAKTIAEASNAGLKDVSYSLEEINVLGQRPTIDDWYVGSAMRPSEKVVLDGYHDPKPYKIGPPPGYGGYIPRFANKIGVRYGDSAKTYFKAADLEKSGQILVE